MLGEQPDLVDVGEHGIVGDRAYALIDSETGKVVSAKNPRQWPQMFNCRAEFVEPPKAGQPLPPVRITLADDTTVASDEAEVDARLSAFFGRAVVLAAAAPEDFTIDEYRPDLEGVGSGHTPDTVTDQKLGAAFFADAGMPSAVPVGSFMDLFPVSVLTTSTVNHLNEIKPDSRFDARRFRMNVVVDTSETGFVENGWLGHQLQFGDGAALVAMIPDPRCVMTTLAQEDLPKDNGILQTLARHNRLEVAGAGLFPCAGVYAVVGTPGIIRTGDAVVLG
jgi:uncharacterized protein YcbX